MTHNTSCPISGCNPSKPPKSQSPALEEDDLSAFGLSDGGSLTLHSGPANWSPCERQTKLPTTAFHTPSTAGERERGDTAAKQQDGDVFLPLSLFQRNRNVQVSSLIGSSGHMRDGITRALCPKKGCSPRTQRYTNGKPLIHPWKRERFPCAKADSRLLYQHVRASESLNQHAGVRFGEGFDW
jgi:hypothetical protein